MQHEPDAVWIDRDRREERLVARVCIGLGLRDRRSGGRDADRERNVGEEREDGDARKQQLMASQ